MTEKESYAQGGSNKGNNKCATPSMKKKQAKKVTNTSLTSKRSSIP